MTAQQLVHRKETMNIETTAQQLVDALFSQGEDKGNFLWIVKSQPSLVTNEVNSVTIGGFTQELALKVIIDILSKNND